MNTNEKGKIGVSRIIFEATKKGHNVSVPLDGAIAYDLVVDKSGKLQRVQVKTTRSDGTVIKISTTTTKTHINGKKRSVHYGTNDFDWMVIYDLTSDGCYYVPMSVVSSVRSKLYLRLKPTKNNRREGVLWADDFLEWK